MCVIEVFPHQDGWSVRLEDEPPLACFPTRDQAERRARWMAVRQAVRDLEAEIHLLDASGLTVGRWIDERYVEPVQPRRAA